MADNNALWDDPSLEVYEQVVDGLDSGVLAVDGDGVILMANPAAHQHLDLPAGTLCRGIRLVKAAVPKQFADLFEPIIEARCAVRRGELRLPRAGGKPREIGFSVSLLENGSDLPGLIMLFTDMTERRHLERVAELNRQLANVGELTAGVVHELRNPITVIEGMAELLVRQIQGPLKARRNAEAILNEARQLERLVHQFLGFARPFEVVARQGSPRAIADRTELLCRSRAREKQVRIIIDCPPDIPCIWADIDKAAEALSCIMSNAVDVSTEHSTVTLRLSATDRDVVFEVLDEGPGLELDSGDDIFAPFFTKKADGTGLGLPIAHRIITAHDGSISFDNRPEGGARFEVRLPRARDNR